MITHTAYKRKFEDIYEIAQHYEQYYFDGTDPDIVANWKAFSTALYKFAADRVQGEKDVEFLAKKGQLFIEGVTSRYLKTRYLKIRKDSRLRRYYLRKM